jgi:transcriptional regulator of arginine metabolism
MKLEFVIKNLIQNNKIKTQSDLGQILKKKGFETTQSNISRILKKLNTVKLIDEDRETYYIIHNKPLEITSWIKNLIINTETNGNIIVIKTYPGAAELINQILKERNIENILDSISSHESVVIIPSDIKFVDTVISKIKMLFMLNNEYSS